MLHKIDLLTFDSLVSSPEGMIYSTAPHIGYGSDGITYFVKGPEPEVIFAEIAGCLFAREVGLIVPDVAICRFEDSKFCGSAKVEGLRNVAPWLARTQKVRNASDLYNVIVVDAWLANDDRNMGNILARPVHGSEVEIVMIDFEKSKALRPNPIIVSTMLKPGQLWPREELGQILRQQKPLFASLGIIERIRNVGRDRCTEIIMDVAGKMGPVDWADNSIDVVSRRAERIAEIASEIWKQN
jgi:hypothetical protein